MPSIVVLCDQADADSVSKVASQCSVIPIDPSKNLHEQVRKVACTHKEAVFCNWCRGGLEEAGRASARGVAEVLGALKVAVASNSLQALQLDTEDLQMLCAYGKVPLVPFCFLRSGEGSLATTSDMRYPLSLWNLNEGLCAPTSLIQTVADEAQFQIVVSEALAESPVILVTEGAVTHVASLAWYGGDSVVVGDAHPVAGGSVATAVPEDVVKSIVGAGILKVSGTLNVSLTVSAEQTLVCFVDVVGRHLLHALEPGFDMEAHLGKVVPTTTAAFELAKPRHVVSYDPKMKGYFLRASMDVQKGDVVFRDERRRFSIATKPHVESTWSEEEKVVFSEYGWPLDTEGHVYALWDDEPRLWRPINHSCDPNLFFGDGHSLNVVATRDIKRGEDLSLDYATFCDFTMKPFQCFCGASCCRGNIQPDAASLAKYGANAWHRRHPTTPQ